ncbi:uncharacterized protein LOC106643982 isoform X2 [Copidosoma floridanum]|uniref:uncharacterized protein LOC106643982 isoform X2 n=1 Tax=Copidosoma floridanum TaxID=29053 RepID=UPI0006C98D30|nr:uncharacterized protein LOC106643982 isoform X2 [Copidosoma floridanum]
MKKNISLLESVSKYFTEEALRSIVAKFYKTNVAKVEISSWDFGNASKKGDSYLSTVDRVIVKGLVKNEAKQVNLVVKSLPNNPGRRKTFRSAEFFRNEIIFYSEIATRFNEFLESKNQSSMLNLPDCLAYQLDGENDYIALEDVSPYGFGPVARQSCLDFQEFVIVLKALARFHGVSFAYKDQYKDEYTSAASKLKETYFRSDLYNSWYTRYHDRLLEVTRDALAKEYPGSRGEQRFNSYARGELYRKSVDFCSRIDGATSVVNQGDSWAPNFLMRTTELGQVEVLLLDFQLARHTSPVLDLSFFIYSCTDKKVRDLHFDELLKIYHDEVSKTVTALGSDTQKIYPWSVFIREVKEQFIHGLVFGMESITMSMLSEDESFDLDVIKEDKVDIADIWATQNIKTSENRRRLADVVLHAADRGYL